MLSFQVQPVSYSKQFPLNRQKEQGSERKYLKNCQGKNPIMKFCSFLENEVELDASVVVNSRIWVASSK